MIPAQAVPWPTTSSAVGVVEDQRVVVGVGRELHLDAADELPADRRMVALHARSR